MTAYYNEFDKYAAQWLRNLIAAGHIAPGDVDDRSISDVKPSELAGYTQCHFFAGIGGWSLALRLAGWPDHRRVWTGSCPCQPFSVAGQGHGVVDERHLWPHWFHLIRAQRPPVVLGEQVEAAINHGWLDLVQDDLEGEGYAFAPVGIPAAGVGAPHIRQRLWFVADSMPAGRPQWWPESGGGSVAGYGIASQLAHNNNPGPQGREPVRQRTVECAVGSGRMAGVVGVSDSTGSQQGWQATATPGHRDTAVSTGQWDACDWLPCRDGKWRPVEPGTFPLAHGVSNRVGRLRAYGNAIVPQVAAQVIQAYMECRPC
jgi:DNA (cytosine-5)-methyltransferase 1